MNILSSEFVQKTFLGHPETISGRPNPKGGGLPCHCTVLLQLVQDEFGGGVAAKQICTGVAQVVDQVQASYQDGPSVRLTHLWEA